MDAKTDAGGHVRFSPLPKGEYLAVIYLGPNASWYPDATRITDGEKASVRWTLGTRTIRGRLPVEVKSGKTSVLEVHAP